MRRFVMSVLALLAIIGTGVGCHNVGRLGCEVVSFYADVERNVFGIDYPHGWPESNRQKYVGLQPPGKQPLCDD